MGNLERGFMVGRERPSPGARGGRASEVCHAKNTVHFFFTEEREYVIRTERKTPKRSNFNGLPRLLMPVGVDSEMSV